MPLSVAMKAKTTQAEGANREKQTKNKRKSERERERCRGSEYIKNKISKGNRKPKKTAIKTKYKH